MTIVFFLYFFQICAMIQHETTPVLCLSSGTTFEVYHLLLHNLAMSSTVIRSALLYKVIFVKKYMEKTNSLSPSHLTVAAETKHYISFCTCKGALAIQDLL